MDDLVYDRLLSDVNVALNNPGSSKKLKGAYNYTDLNRVENWCEYLYNLFVKFGFTTTLSFKTDWDMLDYPTRTEMDRIRQNIDYLKNFCTSIDTETITYNNTMNYEQANILEKILYDIYQYYLDLQRQIELAYNFGATLVHNKFVYLTMDTETITKRYTLALNTSVGLTLVHKKYIFLKEED